MRMSLALASLLLASPALAQNLRHVRVETSGAPALAAALEDQGYDVVEGSVRPGSLELVVSDPSFDALFALGYAPEVLAVGRPFADIQAERLDAEGNEDMPPPAGYPDWTGVRDAMNAAAAAYPAICQFVNVTQTLGVPKTFIGRNIVAVKISDNVAQDEDEPALLIHSAAHCRELVTPVIALDAIERFTTGYGVDPVITNLVDNWEIWIIPVANPDGYNWVFTQNNLWRKNRNPYPGGTGVDLNRNYPFGWNAPCSGSSNAASNTYKGPSPGSEAETMNIMALSEDVRFTKVIDYHSFGRQVLWEYSCNAHPLANWLMAQAVGLANLAGYAGGNRPPSAEGEHFEWQLAQYSNHSFLIETSTAFQPPYSAAQAEAALVWPATLGFLNLPIPVSGHVTDACTGQPLEASITYVGLPFTNGETNTSEPDFGRYHAFLPLGVRTLRFTAPGYQPQDLTLTVVESGAVIDVALFPTATAQALGRNGTGLNASCYTNVTPAVIGGTWTSEVDHSGHPGASFTAILLYAGAATGPVTGFGELLVDLGTQRLFQSLIPSTGTEDVHSYGIPNDPCLAGVFTATQAAILGGGAELCNAIDLTVGY